MKNFLKPLSTLGIALACSWQVATAQDTPVKKTQNHVKIMVIDKDGKKHTIDEKFDGKMPKELKERIKVLQQKTGSNFVLHTDKNIQFEHQLFDKLPAHTQKLIEELKKHKKDGKKGLIRIKVVDENGKVKVTEKKLSGDDHGLVKHRVFVHKEGDKLHKKGEVSQKITIELDGNDKDHKKSQHVVFHLDSDDKNTTKVTKSKHFVIRIDGDDKVNHWIHKEGDKVVKLHFDEKNFSGKKFILKDGNTVKVMIHKIVEVIEDKNPSKKEEETKARKTKNFDALSELNFYPNPNGGKFKLKFKLAEQGNTKVAIYDLKGNVVYSEELPNFQGVYDKPIDLSQQNRGVYIVRISQNGHTITRKLKIQ